MRCRIDKLRHDSSFERLDLRSETNEPAQFLRPVGSKRKPCSVTSKSRSTTGRVSLSGSRVSSASVIRQKFNRPKKGSGLDDFGAEGKWLKLPSRVKGIEMKVSGVLPAEPQKAIPEGEKRKAWLHTESRLIDSKRNLSQTREGKSLLPPPESIQKERNENGSRQ